MRPTIGARTPTAMRSSRRTVEEVEEEVE